MTEWMNEWMNEWHEWMNDMKAEMTKESPTIVLNGMHLGLYII